MLPRRLTRTRPECILRSALNKNKTLLNTALTASCDYTPNRPTTMRLYHNTTTSAEQNSDRCTITTHPDTPLHRPNQRYNRGLRPQTLSYLLGGSCLPLLPMASAGWDGGRTPVSLAGGPSDSTAQHRAVPTAFSLWRGPLNFGELAGTALAVFTQQNAAGVCEVNPLGGGRGSVPSAQCPVSNVLWPVYLLSVVLWRGD